MPNETNMSGPIIGVVPAGEVLTGGVHHAVSLILTDRQALLAQDADAFEARAREVLNQARPDHDREFGNFVVKVAMRQRPEQTTQLTLTARALAQLEALAAQLPDTDAATELHIEIAAATRRLNWPDTTTSSATPQTEA